MNRHDEFRAPTGLFVASSLLPLSPIDASPASPQDTARKEPS